MLVKFIIFKINIYFKITRINAEFIFQISFIVISSKLCFIFITEHPNMKLFISHGGNSGSIEAVHYGIPMVGIPLFFDQHRIIHNFVEKGVAVRLGINELTKNNILSCIKTVINDEG